MLTEIPTEQFAAAVETIAQEVLADVGWSEPPVDVLAVARRLGILVARDDTLDTRARFVRLGQVRAFRQETIFLAEEPRSERRQWAVAHEVGESIAHRVFAQLGIALVDIPPRSREHVANHLASCLLLPCDWFAKAGAAVRWDLRELKSIYATASHELIARRLLEMAPTVIVTLFDQGATQWRRSNVELRPPALSLSEAEVWRATFESGEPTTCDDRKLPDGIAGIQGWAIHEPGWRREILRTELVEW